MSMNIKGVVLIAISVMLCMTLSTQGFTYTETEEGVVEFFTPEDHLSYISQLVDELKTDPETADSIFRGILLADDMQMASSADYDLTITWDELLFLMESYYGLKGNEFTGSGTRYGKENNWHYKIYGVDLPSGVTIEAYTNAIADYDMDVPNETEEYIEMITMSWMNDTKSLILYTNRSYWEKLE